MSELSKLADEVRAIAQSASRTANDLNSMERELGNLIRQVQAAGREGVDTGPVARNLEQAVSAVANAKHGLSEIMHKGKNYADRLTTR